MEYRTASLPRRLAIEKQLLAEEKFLVAALKKVQEEQHRLQVERLQMMSMLHELQQKGMDLMQGTNPQQDPTQETPASEPTVTPTDFASEFGLPSMDDDDLINEMDLNLTVPQHSFHEPLMEEIEEEDYEIEIGMLMNMKTNTN